MPFPGDPSELLSIFWTEFCSCASPGPEVVVGSALLKIDCDTVDLGGGCDSLLEDEEATEACGAARADVTEVASVVEIVVLEGKVGVCGIAVRVTILAVEEAAGPRAGGGAVEEATTAGGNSVLVGDGDDATLEKPPTEDADEGGDSADSGPSSSASTSSPSATAAAALDAGATSRIQSRRSLASRLLLSVLRLATISKT